MERLVWDMFPSETRDIIEGQIPSLRQNGVKYVVVWLHAEWCGPCRAIEDDVRNLIENVNQSTPIDWKWFDIMVPRDEFEKQELKEVWGFTTIPIFFVLHMSTETWTQ